MNNHRNKELPFKFMEQNKCKSSSCPTLARVYTRIYNLLLYIKQIIINYFNNESNYKIIIGL